MKAANCSTASCSHAVPCAGRASGTAHRLAQPIQASGDQVIVSTAPDALNGDLLIYSVC